MGESKVVLQSAALHGAGQLLLPLRGGLRRGHGTVDCTWQPTTLFTWIAETQNSFDELKAARSSGPVFDLACHKFLSMDASNIAVAAILTP